MHLVGRQGGGGRGLQRRGIKGRPLLQPADPRLARSLGPEGLDRRHLPLERRPHPLVEQARGVVAIGVAEADGLGPARDRGGDHRLLARLVQRRHLFQRAIKDEVRRDHAHCAVVAQAVGLLVHLDGEARDPVQIGLGIAELGDLMLGVQEIGHALIGAGLLADHIGRGPIAAAAEAEPQHRGPAFQRIEHGVVIDLAGAAQRPAINALQPPQLAVDIGVARGDAREGFVAQAALQIVVGTLVQAELGGRLGISPKVCLEKIVQQPLEPRVLVSRGQGRQRSQRRRGG